MSIPLATPVSSFGAVSGAQQLGASQSPHSALCVVKWLGKKKLHHVGKNWSAIFRTDSSSTIQEAFKQGISCKVDQ
jgi:hypothetical protein